MLLRELSLRGSLRREDVELHLLVKNGASVVGRLLEQLAPHAGSVIAVLDDCSDGTDVVIRGLGTALRMGFIIKKIDRTSHPSLYQLDDPSTYQEGRPLAGEDEARLLGPFTGQHMLADFAAARNIGWGFGDARWRLVLDVDDVVEDSASILPLCAALDREGMEAASARYLRGPGEGSYRERLARNIPEIRWAGACHEHLAGMVTGRAAHVEGSLVVRDLMDSAGSGSTRVQHRNLKILYRRARRAGWDAPPRDLIYLAAEVRGRAPELTKRLCEIGMKGSDFQVERAWAMALRGMVDEDACNFSGAADWYRRALEMWPSSQAALLLARSLFRRERWGEVVDAWGQHEKLRGSVQLVDLGVREDAVAVMAASALAQVGELSRAMALCRDVRSRRPGSQGLARFAEALEGVTGAGERP